MYQRLLYGVMGALMMGSVYAWVPHDGCAHTMSPNMSPSEGGAEELMPSAQQMPYMPSVLTPESPQAKLYWARRGLFKKVPYGLESRKSRRNDRKKEKQWIEEKKKRWIKEHQHQQQ
ncbi:hypothetical protein [Candidatus Hepatobacter penaei]|uniref:hypothetical protein n=1 Tax=Candidatus Hepatobacter penaei TaxID=1274402 RepID=UPI0004F35E5D|nr:hypothetical protein [Candidatus Hepatobacter penaei]